MQLPDESDAHLDIQQLVRFLKFTHLLPSLRQLGKQVRAPSRRRLPSVSESEWDFLGGRSEDDVEIGFHRDLWHWLAAIWTHFWTPSHLGLVFQQTFLSSNSYRLTLTQTSRTGMHLSQALQGTLSRLRSIPAW